MLISSKLHFSPSWYSLRFFIILKTGHHASKVIVYRFEDLNRFEDLTIINTVN
jgi:hypothetical protein